MLLKDAHEIANDLVSKLSQHCTLINIAGSCRRQKPEVKDIEIVALPKYIEVPKAQQDLFETTTLMETIISPEYVKEYNKIGTVIKGTPQGRYTQFELSQGIKLDLFTPQEEDYYRIFAMRTGSSAYSAREIARGWKNIGWCGTDDGLRKISECKKHNGKWQCTSSFPTLPPHWKSEEEFFDWIKVKWIDPSERI